MIIIRWYYFAALLVVAMTVGVLLLALFAAGSAEADWQDGYGAGYVDGAAALADQVAPTLRRVQGEIDNGKS